MAQPNTFDGRKGLQREVLDELRRADRVTLAIREDVIAVLGYWVSQPESQGPEEAGFILLDLEKALLFPPSVPARRRSHAQLLVDIERARQNERWKRVLDMLRPGDVIRVPGRRLSARWLPPRTAGRARLNLLYEGKLLATLELSST